MGSARERRLSALLAVLVAAWLPPHTAAADPAALQSSLMGAALLPPGKALHDVLAPDVYRLAEQEARGLGIELKLLDRFEPWLVAITMLDRGMSKIGYRAEHGLEQYLVQKARRRGTEVLGLETPAFQFGLFAALPQDEQQALLEQTLHELGGAPRLK